MRWLLLFAVLPLAACSATSENLMGTDAGLIDLGAPPLCTPGAQVACACPGGAASVQVCQVNGTLGACACGTADAATDAVDGARDPVALFVDCSSSNPCDGDALCVSATGPRGVTVNFCTLRCDGVAPCPLGAACGSLVDGPSVCLMPCAGPGTVSCGFTNAVCGTVRGVAGYVCTVP